MIEGVKLKFGDKEVIAPPLNLKAMRRLLPKIQSLKTTGTPDDGDLVTICEIVHAALLRNYPEITIDEVEENLDMINIQGIVAKVLGQSGLEQGKLETAIIPVENSIGQSSTGTLSPLPDGPMTT